MTASLFVSGTRAAPPGWRADPAVLRAIAQGLRGIAALCSFQLCEPAGVQTYHRDGPPPALALRLDFADLPALEQALLPGGAIYQLAHSPLWHALALDDVQHQAMLRRRCYEEDGNALPGEGAGTYWVHYPGRAQDFNAWLRYYLQHHPQVMRHYPGIRAIDVFTRLDWCDDLPWTRAAHMQRNSLVFDSPTALADAIASPVRLLMRSDHEAFPPYEGGSRHWALRVAHCGEECSEPDPQAR